MDTICRLSSESHDARINSNNAVDSNNMELHVKKEGMKEEDNSFRPARKDNNIYVQNDTIIDTICGLSSDDARINSNNAADSNQMELHVKKEGIKEKDNSCGSSMKDNNISVQNDTVIVTVHGLSSDDARTNSNKTGDSNTVELPIKKEGLKDEDNSCGPSMKDDNISVQNDTVIVTIHGLSSDDDRINSNNLADINQMELHVKNEGIKEEDNSCGPSIKDDNISVQNDTVIVTIYGLSSDDAGINSNKTADSNTVELPIKMEGIEEEDNSFGPARTDNNNFLQNDTVTDTTCIRGFSSAKDSGEIHSTMVTGVSNKRKSTDIILSLIEVRAKRKVSKIEACTKRKAFVSLGERVTECEICHKFFTGTKPFQRHKLSCNEMYDPTYHSSTGRNVTVTKRNGRQNAFDIEMKVNNISETEGERHSNELSRINRVMRMTICDNMSESVKRRNHDCSKSAFTESVEVQKMFDEAKCVNDYQEINKVEQPFEYGTFHEPFVAPSYISEVDITKGIENSCHEYILKEGENNATRSDNLKQHVDKHTYTKGQNLTCNEKEKKAYFEEEIEGNSVGNFGANIVDEIEANSIEESEANIADTGESDIESEFIIIGVRETSIIGERVASNTGDVGSNNAGENESNISEESETNIIGKGEADIAEEIESNFAGETEANIATEHRDNTVDQTCEICKRQTRMSKRNADNRCKEGGRQDVSKYKNATISDINQSSYGDTDNESKDTSESDSDNYNSDESWKQSSCDDTYNESDQSSKSTTDFRISDGSRDRRKRATSIENSKYKCSICDFKSKWPTDLTRHMRIHTGERPFECGTCHKNFTKSAHLRRHVSKRTCVCEENPIQTPVLSKEKKAISYPTQTKSSKRVVEAIEAYIGREILATFVAESEANVAGEGEATFANIREEIEANIVEESETNSVGRREEKLKGESEANIADLTFQSESILTCHMKIDNIERSFECDACHKTFTRSDLLKRHVSNRVCLNEGNTSNVDESLDCRKHAGSIKNRKYKCSICNSSLKNQSCLTRHYKVHSEEKPFECGKCHYTFKRRDTLKRHVSQSCIKISTVSENTKCINENKKIDRKERVCSTTDSKYKCSICNFSSKKQSCLIRHYKIHSEERPFECEKCHYTFKRRDTLKRHVSQSCKKISTVSENTNCINEYKKINRKERVCNTDRKYKCSICQYTCRRPYIFIIHMRKHSGETPFKCDRCHQMFGCRETLKMHQRDIHGLTTAGNVRKKFTCGICQATFSWSGGLSRHKNDVFCSYRVNYAKNTLDESSSSGSDLEKETLMSTENISGRYMKHYKNDDKSFECIHCHKTFNSRNGIEYHIKAQLDKVKQRKASYLCQICNTEFDMKCKWAYHRVFEHGGNKFKCVEKDNTGSECGEQFSSYKQLRKHFFTEHRNMRYLCDICGKAYLTAHVLRVHKASHTSERSVQCSVCGKRYASNYYLKQHMRNIHVQQYVCEFCPKQFTNKLGLENHLRTHTKKKPYKCSKCDMKFRQCGSMKRHEVTHTLAKKYTCKLCEKSFTQSQSLTRHMITHTGKTPYRCEPCGLDFREGYRLKLHREKVHNLVLNKSNE